MDTGQMYDLIGFKAIWSHSVHLSQNGLYLENSWSWSETEFNLGLMYTSDTYMRYI